MHRRDGRLVVLAVVALTVVGPGMTGCAKDNRPVKRASTLTGDLRIFAASSLTEVFTELGTAFERRHPGVEVVANFNFAASSTLARQIDAGAPADVFAAADEATMRSVRSAGGVREPTPFARNRLSLLVEHGNPEHINGLGDLVRPGVTFSACAPEVPCGALASAALTRAGVAVKPISLEANVKAVVSRVALGEVDAGIVYATDVRAAGDRVTGVAIDVARDPDLEAVYEIGVVRSTRERAAAQAWIAFVVSREGAQTLGQYGFLPP